MEGINLDLVFNYLIKLFHFDIHVLMNFYQLKHHG